MSEQGFRTKNSQFPISAEINVTSYFQAIRDTKLNFSEFSYLIDTKTWSKFHQNL